MANRPEMEDAIELEANGKDTDTAGWGCLVSPVGKSGNFRVTVSNMAGFYQSHVVVAGGRTLDKIELTELFLFDSIDELRGRRAIRLNANQSDKDVKANSGVAVVNTNTKNKEVIV